MKMKDIYKMYHESHDPNGWVIGSEVKSYIMDYFGGELTHKKDLEDDSNLRLMGLPYIVDTQNPTRIEIIE